MDWEFIRRFLPEYGEAALLTLRIGTMGIVLSLGLGFLFSALMYFKVPVLKRLAGAVVELSRNTPLLVQLFFLYYGLPKIGVRISQEACAIIGLTFLGSGYMAGAFESGLLAVERIQMESALSLGLKRGQAMVHVIFPQALAISVPSLVANMVFLLKETSVFSAIAVADLMFVAKDLIGLYYKTAEALLLLVGFYLIILLPVSVAGTVLERRLRFAGFGNNDSF